MLNKKLLLVVSASFIVLAAIGLQNIEVFDGFKNPISYKITVGSLKIIQWIVSINKLNN